MHPPSLNLLRALHTLTSNPITMNPTTTSRHSISLSHRLNTCISARRTLHTTNPFLSPGPKPILNPRAPKSHDRGPRSTETTQTDFSQLDILSSTSAPATSIDACTTDAFHLNNGLKTPSGAAVLLIAGEAFAWRPWFPQLSPSGLLGVPSARPGSKTKVLKLDDAALGVLELLYPKPDLLVLGTGGRLWQVDMSVRERLSRLGIRLDVMDTANAAAAYNLLATERGVENIAGAMVPVGWVGKE